MALLIAFGVPTAAAFFIIFALSLNGINPWAGKPKPVWMINTGIVIAVALTFHYAVRFFGGAR